MAGVTDLSPDLDRLDSQLDELEDALRPLLDGLGVRASQLPLLDKAKLFSLVAYAIESLLFSSLRLQGVDAQNHAVHNELKRVRQYFAKIQAAEEAERHPSLTVDREAAARIVKAGLSDNKALGAKLAEKIAEERAKALLRAVQDSSSRTSAAANALAPSRAEEKRERRGQQEASKNKVRKKSKRK